MQPAACGLERAEDSYIRPNYVGPSGPPLLNCQQDWPSDIVYLPRCIYSYSLSPQVLTDLHTAPSSISNSSCNIIPSTKLPPSPNPALYIQYIDDTSHPAFGQRGLFAARNLEPGSLVCLYSGIVNYKKPGERTGDGRVSDYDLSLCRELALEGSIDDTDCQVLNISIDAENAGNEARFVNDYRGVPLASHSISTDGRQKSNRGPAIFAHEAQQAGKSQPNVEFREIWVRRSRRDGRKRDPYGQYKVSQAQFENNNRGHNEGVDVAHSVSTDVESLGTSRGPNSFMDITAIGRKWEGALERCMALFVLSPGKKFGTKRAKGILKGEELLISYGRGFWKHSVEPSDKENAALEP